MWTFGTCGGSGMPRRLLLRLQWVCVMTRPGGYAALLQACCYVFGFVLLVTVMNPGDTAGWTSVQKLEFVLQREALFQL